MNPLRLVALDEEDLQIISAHIQDAVVRVGDIEYLDKESRLILIMNRYAWEIPQRIFRKHNERRRSILRFDRVLALESTGVGPKDKDEVLNILALQFEAVDIPSGNITIICSGNVTFRLKVECIEAELTDLGSAWRASGRPAHKA